MTSNSSGYYTGIILGEKESNKMRYCDAYGNKMENYI
jgi:hypothetical protein